MADSQSNIESLQQDTQSKNVNIKSFNMDEFQTTIFDLGSYNYRIGYSGNDRPNYIFPPIKFINTNSEQQETEYEYLTSQKGDGYFLDIKKFEDFFDDFISDKEIVINEMNQSSLLFSEPVIHNKEQRIKLTEYLFEKYQIGGLFFCNSSVLSSFSYGKTSCLVFDSGNAQSNIVPVYDGMIIKNALNFFLLNGKYVDELIINELIGKQIDNFKSYNILQNIQILSDLKDIIFTSDNIKNNYILPDNKNIIIDDNYLSIIKKNIETKLFNEELNLKTLILKSISSVLLDIKKDLVNNIFICGGNSLILNNYFNNIKEALSKELVSSAIVRITTHPSKIERSLACFLGASIISSLNIYKETIVKKEEYEEHGAIIIEKKCA